MRKSGPADGHHGDQMEHGYVDQPAKRSEPRVRVIENEAVINQRMQREESVKKLFRKTSRDRKRSITKDLPVALSAIDIPDPSHIIVIFVYKNGDDVNPPTKITLKKFDTWNILRAKDCIGEKVQPAGGYVDSLRTVDGEPVEHITDVQNNEYYVALGPFDNFVKANYNPHGRKKFFVPTKIKDPYTLPEEKRKPLRASLPNQRTCDPNDIDCHESGDEHDAVEERITASTVSVRMPYMRPPTTMSDAQSRGAYSQYQLSTIHSHVVPESGARSFHAVATQPITASTIGVHMNQSMLRPGQQMHATLSGTQLSSRATSPMVDERLTASTMDVLMATQSMVRQPTEAGSALRALASDISAMSKSKSRLDVHGHNEDEAPVDGELGMTDALAAAAEAHGPDGHEQQKLHGLMEAVEASAGAYEPVICEQRKMLGLMEAVQASEKAYHNVLVGHSPASGDSETHDASPNEPLKSTAPRISEVSKEGTKAVHDLTEAPENGKKKKKGGCC